MFIGFITYSLFNHLLYTHTDRCEYGRSRLYAYGVVYRIFICVLFSDFRIKFKLCYCVS
jgi:hypothetical protein